MSMVSSDNILYDSQLQVCDYLSSSSSLSSVCFIAENSKDIDFQIQNALKRQGICGLVMTPDAEFIGRYSDGNITYQLDLEIMITENVSINRAKGDSITGQDAAMLVFDVLGKDRYGQFSPVSYSQGEDSGLIVNRCKFRCYVRP